jgi:hypothetical protein
MQKDQMKTLLSIVVSAVTFFSSRCETTKSERQDPPDAAIAAARPDALLPDAAEPVRAADRASTLSPSTPAARPVAPAAPTPARALDQSLHSGPLSSAAQRALLSPFGF